MDNITGRCHGYLQFVDEIPEVPGRLDEGAVEG